MMEKGCAPVTIINLEKEKSFKKICSTSVGTLHSSKPTKEGNEMHNIFKQKRNERK